MITLEKALPFVRELETKLIPFGAHCALGGSVLHSGESRKDLDVFVYPHNREAPLTPEELMEVLRTIYPTGWEATDKSYPYDRRRWKLFEEGFGTVEIFVFLYEPPVEPAIMGRG